MEFLLLSEDPHVVCITETWLNSDVSSDCIVPPGYTMLRWDRDSRGGGVAIIVKSSLSVSTITSEMPESVWCKIMFSGAAYVIGAIYRPPNTSSDFLDKLNEFLFSHVTRSTRLVMTGDFNLPHIDWGLTTPGHTEISSAEKLLDIAFFYNLRQVVGQPTRISPQSQSLLDLVFLSNNVGDIETNVTDGISDHKIIFVTVLTSANVPAEPMVRVEIKEYGKADDTSILDYLETCFDEFESASENASVECLWQRLKVIISTCVDRYVPTRVKKTKQRNPWVTRDIIHAKRKLKRLRRKKADFNDIQVLRQKIKMLLSAAKERFFNHTLSGFLRNSPEKFWRYLDKRKERVKQVTVGAELIADKTNMADHFNKYFQSVFARNTSQSDAHDEAHSRETSIDAISFTQSGVFQQLIQLDEKKAIGPDGIPTCFLRRYAEWMSFYLVIIFRKSLVTHYLPQDWRTAIVIPVFKSGNRTLMNNYRPVSLTSICCKVMEHVIAKHIIIFLETNGLLSECQHGFRRGFSTVTQLIETIHDLSKAIDDRGQIDVICVDFEKAFDKVPHDKLLLKVRRAGINGDILRWIEAYLAKRKQAVRVDNCESRFLDVYSGVPQGSVLGPLLFLVYINDVVCAVGNSVKLKLFADDCLIYAPVTCEGDQININQNLQAFALWCEKWEMKINFNKTTFTHITNKRNIISFQYSIAGHDLVNVSTFKYLGVSISHNLSWHNHVENVCAVAHRKLCFLRGKLGRATKDVKLLAYKSLIRPSLEYASVVWSPRQKILSMEIEKIQRRAARFICSKYRTTDSVTEMLNSCSLETLEKRRKKQRLKILYQIIHGEININKEKYLQPPGRLSSRLNHHKAIRPYLTRTNVFRCSFFPDAIEHWNKLPAHVAESTGVAAFLNALGDSV